MNKELLEHLGQGNNKVQECIAQMRLTAVAPVPWLAQVCEHCL